MKNLFLSPESVIEREYRHGQAYRIAALILLAFLGLQIAVIAAVIYCWRSEQQLNNQSMAIARRAAELNNTEASLKDVRQKLERIQSWAPILARRIPVSSMLAAVETAIPTEVVLDRLTIEIDSLESLPVRGGTYRVPGEYRLGLFGLQKSGTSAAEFQQKLRNALPTGSEVTMQPLNSADANGLSPFEITALIRPNGNYQPLGLQKVISENRQ